MLNWPVNKSPARNIQMAGQFEAHSKGSRLAASAQQFSGGKSIQFDGRRSAAGRIINNLRFGREADRFCNTQVAGGNCFN